jgi:hypothetical protein
VSKKLRVELLEDRLSPGVYSPARLWDNEVPFQFLGGPLESQQLILDAINEVEDACGLEFKVGQPGGIRVEFTNLFFRSYVGIDAKFLDSSLPTLSTSFTNYSTALHELMHAVGFLHEHQHLDSPDTFGDLRAGVEGGAAFTPYDKDSITHYFNGSQHLSPGDIVTLRMIYPEVGDNDLNNYIQKLYVDLTHRQASPYEKSMWLVFSKGNRQTIADGVLGSDEAKYVAIDTLYRDYLGRPLTTKEFPLWGEYSLDKVKLTVLASDEYFTTLRF